MPLIWIALAISGAGLGVWFWRRSTRPIYPPAESYIQPPREDATLVRTADGGCLLHSVEPPLTIYAGGHPSQIDRSTLLPFTVQGDGWHIPAYLLAAYPRPYLELHFTDRSRIMVAERILKVDGVANFRDIGGYPTADGRRSKWGVIYRTGMLAHLTEDGRRFLRDLGVRWVCDVRSAEEAQQDPDRIRDNPNIRYDHMPMNTPDESMKRLRALLFNRRALPSLMLETYTHIMIDLNARTYGNILRHFADPHNLPGILHCTAGKDRTGIGIALLLLLLGVPEEIVIADYSLSNRYFATFRQYTAPLAKRLRWFGLTLDDITPLLIADPAILRGALAHLRAKYGSVDAYVRDAAGVDDATIASLRANLLE